MEDGCHPCGRSLETASGSGWPQNSRARRPRHGGRLSRWQRQAPDVVPLPPQLPGFAPVAAADPVVHLCSCAVATVTPFGERRCRPRRAAVHVGGDTDTRSTGRRLERRADGGVIRTTRQPVRHDRCSDDHGSRLSAALQASACRARAGARLVRSSGARSASPHRHTSCHRGHPFGRVSRRARDGISEITPAATPVVVAR